MFRTSRLARLLVGCGLLMLVGCTPGTAPLPEVLVPSRTPAPPIVFPRDAGPHDGLMEWWYYTGHLSADDGQAYGFEYVVFQARREGAPVGYVAHFAISDIGAQRFSHEARFAQGDVLDFPMDVNGWVLDHSGSRDSITADLHSGYSLQLTLEDEKPPALHHGGYIDLGQMGGSYYYSRTRLRAAGSLVGQDGNTRSVSGVAWMDHQWGNFVIASRGGWDWYSIQLDDNTELMLYVLRALGDAPGGVYGSRVWPDGHVDDLGPGAVSVAPVGEWTSPHTGAVYPSGWRLTLADGATLLLQPQLADQELWFPGTQGLPAYWEGAVTVSGSATGVGYVELTGYAR